MKSPYKTIVRLGSVMLWAFSAMTTVGADYQSTVLSQAPVGYYRLNETVQPPATLPNAINSGSVGAAGNGTFETVSTIRGVAPGAIVSQPANGSVRLTGVVDGNRVRIPYDPAWNTSGPFSFEFWHKPGPGTVSQCAAANVEFIASTPVAQRNGWLLYQNSGGTLTSPGWSLRFYNSTALNGVTILDVAAPVDTNAWYHIVGTFNGTTISLYTNGALAGSTPITGTFRQNTNSAIPLTFGARADGASGYFSSQQASFDEAAYYTTALSPAQVLAHYQAGTNAAPGTPYQNVILADAPVGYWRLDEPGDVITANLGTLGSAGNGEFLPGSIAAAPGAVPPVYPGFAATNTAAAFNANGSSVRIPALNLNTNTITISAWINATNGQQLGSGLVVNGAGSGLIIDGAFGGYGLGYYWNNSAATYNWSPSVDAGLPSLPDSDWAFVALVIQPTEANIYIATTNGGTITFSSVTNFFSHNSQAFSTPTLVGSDAGDPDYSFNGAIDEVAIWKRALSSGELYTQFATAVDSVPAAILTDLVGPAGPAATGDPLTLSINAGGTPPLVYTWYKDSVAIATTTNSGTFTIASVGFGDAGSYEVTVTNNFGTASSQPVAVTVVNPTQPVIVAQQGFYASRTLYPTGTLALAVSATGGGLKYQWYRNGTGIPGATASSYTVASVTTANAGNYTVVVTNSVGAVTNGPAGIVIPTVVTNTYEAAVLASGPQAWWRLDESAGATNLFDAVGRHDGFYTNINGAGPLPTLGVTGALIGNTNRAISFDGSGGIGLSPYSAQLNPGKFSVELWVRTTNLTQVACPASSSDAGGNGWGWIANAGNWNGYSPQGNTVAPLQDYPEYGATIAPGVWTHLVIAYDETTIISGTPYPYRYWINGANAGFVWGGDPATTIAPFIIGGTDPAVRAGRFFNGQVDEIAVYSRVITAAEITNHIVARGVELILPTFTSQPLPQTVTVGKSVTFSASAVGVPTVAYQWFKDGSPVAAATSNSYTIASVTLGNAGAYSLRATNLAGTVFSTTNSLVVVPATAYANITNDLVLHLKLEGNTQDSSGKGNNGTPSGSPAPGFVTGKIGSQAAAIATTLSGTTFSSASYIDLGTPADLLFGSGTSFTVGMWVKLPTNAVPGDVPFIGTEVGAANNPGWFFGPSYQAGGWQWNLNDGVNNFGVSSADNTINDGQWHSYIVTVDRAGAVVKSYLDGILVSSRSITGLGSVDVGGQVVIGQDPSHTYPEATDFNLDDLGIWRRVLTPLEVAQLESAGTAGNSFDTVAPPSVSLTISASGGNIIVGYPSGTLQQSDTVGTGAVWTTVSGASAPSYTTSPTNAAKFYRVLLP